MKQYIFVLLSVVFLSLFLATNTAFASKNDQHVRVLHASTDAPNVDIYLENEQFFSEVPYKYLSEYAQIEKGKYEVLIFPEGANPKKEKPIIKEKLKIKNGETKTLVIIGKEENFSILSLKDDLQLKSGQAKIRFVHLASDVEELDVYDKEELLFGEVAYREDSQYLPLKPNKKNIQFQLSKQKETIYEISNLEFLSRSNYSIFMVGLLKGEPRMEVIITKDHITK